MLGFDLLMLGFDKVSTHKVSYNFWLEKMSFVF